jgi:hypothetical protein
MDIQHTLNARAALTLGKDMVFRDLAQGAFRMRGIGAGQSVSMVVIPEVEELMKRQIKKAGMVRTSRGSQSELLSDVAAWLVINSMRTERVQFDQLCGQNVSTSSYPTHTRHLHAPSPSRRSRPSVAARFDSSRICGGSARGTRCCSGTSTSR